MPPAAATANPPTVQLTHTVLLRYRELLKALRFVHYCEQYLSDQFAPFNASTDYEKQEQEWRCHGCNSVMIKKFRERSKPFPHSNDCQWLHFRNVIDSLGDKK